jgi:hypothetical protein
MKRIIIISLIATMSILSGCSSNKNMDKIETETINVTDKVENILPDDSIEYVNASYVFDIDNPQELVGFVDYVFVGHVDKNVGVEYVEAGEEPSEEGIIISYDPYTTYNVTVLSNIKGELKTDVSIPLIKFGGLNKDGLSYLLMDGDTFPQVGGTYIFTAKADENGELHLTGKNSNIPLNAESKSMHAVSLDENNQKVENIEQTDIYQIYMEAEQNQIISPLANPETSQYDISVE